MRIHPDWRYDPFGEFDTCPACLGPVQPVDVEGKVNFVCAACGCCWHVLLGYIGLVDPATCPGCELRYLCRKAATPPEQRPAAPQPAAAEAQ